MFLRENKSNILQNVIDSIFVISLAYVTDVFGFPNLLIISL
jgi:hypothetical protein